MDHILILDPQPVLALASAGLLGVLGDTFKDVAMSRTAYDAIDYGDTCDAKYDFLTWHVKFSNDARSGFRVIETVSGDLYGLAMAQSLPVDDALSKKVIRLSALEISMGMESAIPWNTEFVVLSDDPEIETLNFGPFCRFASTRGLLAAFEAAGKITSASEAMFGITNNGLILPPEPESRDQIVLEGSGPRP